MAEIKLREMLISYQKSELLFFKQEFNKRIWQVKRRQKVQRRWGRKTGGVKITLSLVAHSNWALFNPTYTHNAQTTITQGKQLFYRENNLTHTSIFMRTWLNAWNCHFSLKICYHAEKTLTCWNMSTKTQCLTANKTTDTRQMCLARISIMPQNALMYTRIHSKLELDGVSWDFEAIIGIKPLEIGCHEVKGKRKRMGCEAEEERKQRNREWGGGEHGGWMELAQKSAKELSYLLKTVNKIILLT